MPPPTPTTIEHPPPLVSLSSSSSSTCSSDGTTTHGVVVRTIATTDSIELVHETVVVPTARNSIEPFVVDHQETVPPPTSAFRNGVTSPSSRRRPPPPKPSPRVTTVTSRRRWFSTTKDDQETLTNEAAVAEDTSNMVQVLDPTPTTQKGHKDDRQEAHEKDPQDPKDDNDNDDNKVIVWDPTPQPAAPLVGHLSSFDSDDDPPHPSMTSSSIVILDPSQATEPSLQEPVDWNESSPQEPPQPQQQHHQGRRRVPRRSSITKWSLSPSSSDAKVTELPEDNNNNGTHPPQPQQHSDGTTTKEEDDSTVAISNQTNNKRQQLVTLPILLSKKETVHVQNQTQKKYKKNSKFTPNQNLRIENDGLNDTKNLQEQDCIQIYEATHQPSMGSPVVVPSPGTPMHNQRRQNTSIRSHHPTSITTKTRLEHSVSKIACVAAPFSSKKTRRTTKSRKTSQQSTQDTPSPPSSSSSSSSKSLQEKSLKQPTFFPSSNSVSLHKRVASTRPKITKSWIDEDDVKEVKFVDDDDDWMGGDTGERKSYLADACIVGAKLCGVSTRDIEHLLEDTLHDMRHAKQMELEAAKRYKKSSHYRALPPSSSSSSSLVAKPTSTNNNISAMSLFTLQT